MLNISLRKKSDYRIQGMSQRFQMQLIFQFIVVRYMCETQIGSVLSLLHIISVKCVF